MEQLGNDINWDNIGSATVKELNYVIQQKQIKVEGNKTKGNLVKALTEYRDNVLSAPSTPKKAAQSPAVKGTTKNNENEQKPPASPGRRGRPRKNKPEENTEKAEEPVPTPPEPEANATVSVTPVNVVHESPRQATPPRHMSPSITERYQSPIKPSKASKKWRNMFASTYKTTLAVLLIIFVIVILYLAGQN